MSNFNDEPSMNKIDDFNGNESKEKRNTVRLVIVGLIVIGALYSFIKMNYGEVNDYVGTSEKPGINTTKGQ